MRGLSASLCLVLIVLSVATASGCRKPPPTYGREDSLALPGTKRQVWAVAPVLNLSGYKQVDPLLHADLVYQQLQQVQGLRVVPVNRVAEVYASLNLEKIQSQEQAVLVCDLLGCDAVLIATVTVYDPYNPPKLGAAMQLFRKPVGYARPDNIDPHDLARRAAPLEDESLPGSDSGFVQVVGVFDAANGSTRDDMLRFAAGRHDPLGPMGVKEYWVDMDRYCGFVYSRLIEQLLSEIAKMRP